MATKVQFLHRSSDATPELEPILDRNGNYGVTSREEFYGHLRGIFLYNTFLEMRFDNKKKLSKQLLFLVGYLR
jgi:hypothetical protein